MSGLSKLVKGSLATMGAGVVLALAFPPAGGPVFMAGMVGLAGAATYTVGKWAYKRIKSMFGGGGGQQQAQQQAAPEERVQSRGPGQAREQEISNEVLSKTARKEGATVDQRQTHQGPPYPESALAPKGQVGRSPNITAARGSDGRPVVTITM